MIYISIYLGIGLVFSLVVMAFAHIWHIREVARLSTMAKIVAIIVASFIWPVCLFATIRVLITKEEKTQ